MLTITSLACSGADVLQSTVHFVRNGIRKVFPSMTATLLASAQGGSTVLPAILSPSGRSGNSRSVDPPAEKGGLSDAQLLALCISALVHGMISCVCVNRSTVV